MTIKLDHVIFEPDGTKSYIHYYKSSTWRKIIVWISYFLTAFILRLIFHWYPHWLLIATHTKSRIEDADVILIKDSFNVYFTSAIFHCYIDNNSSPSQSCPLIKIIGTQTKLTYFIYKRLKYIYSFQEKCFVLLDCWDDGPITNLLDRSPLESTTVNTLRIIYDPNEIIVPISPVLTILLKDGLNPFYIFQVISCILWYSDDYYQYATCIIVISLTSLLWETYETRKNESALHATVCSIGEVEVLRTENNYETATVISTKELVPGDIIKIPPDGCIMYCDALLLTGNCIVNESSLTGESVPVTKTPFPVDEIKSKLKRLDPIDAQSQKFDLDSASRNVLFSGTTIIQTRNFANEPVVALVARTGFRTTRGELIRGILYPKPIEFQFNKDAYHFICFLGAVAAVGFGISVYLMVKQNLKMYTIMKRAFDLITVVVPPALPVAMTVGVVFAQRRLKKKSLYCIHPSAINLCGVINVTCFDKTGTITEDGLDMWGIVPLDETGSRFAEPCIDPGSSLKPGPLIETMAACHSLTRIHGELSGDPLDLKMFHSINWEFTEETPVDHNKFEMTVPVVVRPNNQQKMHAEYSQSQPLPYEVGILRQFPFSSSLQCMSVIARVLNSSHFNVYCKGSPEKIESLCRKDTIPSDFHSVLLEYTREGYRVLALAWRPLKLSYPRALKIPREQVERKLRFLGLLIMENRLKPESAGVILTLKQANIRPIMVTGDNMLTALSVARDCEMIDEFDRVIVVSARAPPNAEEDFTVQLDNSSNSQKFSLKNILTNYVISDVPSQVTNWEHLVEFHYAEDLQRPVMEVTTKADSSRPGGSKSIKNKKTRSSNGTDERKSSWSKNRHSIQRNQGDLYNQNSKSNGAIYRFKRWLGISRSKALEYHRFHDIVSSGSNSITDLMNDYGATEEGLNPSSNGLIRPSGEQVGNQSSTEDHSSPSAHSPHKPRLTIRMLDHPDFHLAISGKTWTTIKEYFPTLIPKLVVKGTVFARFSPDQKMQLVESLQSVGYYVSMCGDGANDCGALKAAHAGVSLSEAEASVASAFTSRVQNISCIPLMIREGRCALATSFGIFKFMAGYSITQFTSVIIFHSVGTTLSDTQFLYIDLFLITTLGISFSYTSAYPNLSVDPPSMRLFSVVTLSSLGLQLLLNAIIQLSAFFYVRGQVWWEDFIHFDQENQFYNYEITAIFIVSVFQYIFLAIVFSKGAPYRKSILTNKLFVINLLITIIVTLVITVYPIPALVSYFSLRPIPIYESHLVLLGFVLINFILAYLFELLVDGMAFRRRMRKIRKILFPRKVQRKDYERIRDEIDRMANIWPPLIRSASVQDIRGDLFQDTQPKFRGQNEYHRNRHASSCTDDESDNIISPTIPILTERNLEAGGEFFGPLDEERQTQIPNITSQRSLSPNIPIDLSLNKTRRSPILSKEVKLHRSNSLDPETVTLGPLKYCIGSNGAGTPLGIISRQSSRSASLEPNEISNNRTSTLTQKINEKEANRRTSELLRRRTKSSDTKRILEAYLANNEALTHADVDQVPKPNQF